MSQLTTLSRAAWAGESGGEAAAELEAGHVLFFPALAFDIEPRERVAFSPRVLAASKNVSFDPASGRVSGTALDGEERACLAGLLGRFSERAAALVDALCPSYRGRAVRARASFRPAEIAGRASSWRKDDTRLHVDSFPASPVHGDRILRLFTNVNPAGKARGWRIGGEFEDAARRFGPALRVPLPGSLALRRLLRLTKSRRSPYDALMLQLHDAMKQDADYQASTPQTRVDFPAGSTWLAFTDEVSHAAMAGQHQLEQTFLLPVAAMRDESRSPLRILERIKGRSLT
jgi:hypothetical protein